MVPLLSLNAIKIKFIKHTFVKTVQSIISILKMYKFSLLFLVVFIFSCTSEKKINEDVLKVSVDVEVDRFDEKFAKATPKDLGNLKKEYPYLFPVQYPDSIWHEKMNDTLQIELEQEVAKVFSDFSEYEDEITLLFQHLKYYFPKFQEPKILTLISDVDYRNSIVLADTLLLVGLDNFLGSEHYFYEGISLYITKNLTPQQLTPAIAETFAYQMVQPPQLKMNSIGPGQMKLKSGVILWIGKYSTAQTHNLPPDFSTPHPFQSFTLNWITSHRAVWDNT